MSVRYSPDYIDHGFLVDFMGRLNVDLARYSQIQPGQPVYDGLRYLIACDFSPVFLEKCHAWWVVTLWVSD